MTPADFAAWMTRMGFGWQDAAKALGLSTRQVRYLASGTYRITRQTELMCQLIESGRVKPAS